MIYHYVSSTTASLIIIMNIIEIIIIFKSKGRKPLAASMLFILNLSILDLFVGVCVVVH